MIKFIHEPMRWMAFFLPIVLTYFIIFFRYIERRHSFERSKNKDIIRGSFAQSFIRDAALASVALDLGEFFRMFATLGVDVSFVESRIIVLAVLLLLHTGSLIFAQTSIMTLDRKTQLHTGIWLRYAYMYIGLAILLTNAVTIMTLIQMVEKS